MRNSTLLSHVTGLLRFSYSLYEGLSHSFFIYTNPIYQIINIFKYYNAYKAGNSADSDKMSQLEISNRQTIIMILGLAGFTVMADNWVVSPLLPAISSSFGVNAATAGVVIAAYMIPFGIFQLVFGPIADRFGKKQVISFAMIFFTFGTGLCGFGFTLSALTTYRAITGIFAASVMPISLALIGDLVPLNERQAAIGSFMGISFLGQGISMALGGTMAYFLNWRYTFILYALMSAFSAILLFTIGRKIPSTKNQNSELLRPYIQLLSKRESQLIYIVIVMEGILIIGSFSYLGAYISSVYNFNFLQIGLVMTSFGVMTVIGGRLVGKLANNIGRKMTLLFGFSLAAVADLSLFSVGNILIVLVLGVSLLGLGFIFAHSTLLTIATEFAQKSRGVAMSLVAGFFMGAGGIGTAIGGKLINSVGLNEFFLIFGLVLLIPIIQIIRLETSVIESKPQ